MDTGPQQTLPGMRQKIAVSGMKPELIACVSVCCTGGAR